MKQVVKTLLVLLFHGLVFSLYAQNEGQNTFEHVRRYADQKNWGRASVILDSLIKNEPANTDYLLYKSRLLAWQGEYINALEALKPLGAYPQAKKEANEVRLLILWWSNRPEEVIKWVDTCIAEQPNKTLYFGKIKAQAYMEVNESLKASHLLDSLMGFYPSDKEVRELQAQIYRQYSQSIGLSHVHTFFTDADLSPWYLSALEFKYRQPRQAYVLRYNQGRTFGRTAGQLEADWYPETGKKSYAYLNMAYAGENEVFPHWRLGAEWYRSFNKRFSGSAGFRFLAFAASQVWLYTGQVQYSQGRISLAYRPFWVQNGGEWLPTHTASVTGHHFASEQSLQVQIQYGVNPYFYTSTQEFSRIQSGRWGIMYDFRIAEHWLGKLSFVQEYEEFVPSQYRSRIYLQAAVYYRFGSFVK